MTTYLTRTAATAALTMGLATAATAQGEPTQELIEAAQEEGALMFYSSTSTDQSEALLAAFEEKYGIPGEFIRFPTTPLLQRFATEFEGGDVQADVLSVSSPLPFQQQPEWFADLSAEELPNYGAWPEEWKGDKSATWTTSIVALAYNTDMVAEGEQPTRWADLTDPKWKGQIMMTDPTVADNYLGWLDAIERDLGMDYLEALSAQDYTLTKSGASGAQMVAAGAFAVNAPTFAAFSTTLIEEKDAPIKVQFMTEPSIVSPRDVAVVEGAPHPNAAKLFVNWLLSREGIELICATTPISVVTDPAGELGCIPLQDAQSMQFEIPDERRDALAAALGVVSN